MQATRILLSVVLLFGATLDGASAAGLRMRVQARSRLRRTSAERVETIARSEFLLENMVSMPKNVSKEKEAKVIESLEDQVNLLKKSVLDINKNAKKEKSAEAQNKSKLLKSSMKPADQAMMEKFDDWSDRMNRKTRLGAMDVISKLENAIHFVKKGALTGNPDAEKNLNDVLGKMGSMMGGAPAGKKQNFLH